MNAVAPRFLALVYHDVHADEHGGYGRLGPSAIMYHVGESAFRRQLDVIQRAGASALGLDSVRRVCAAAAPDGAGHGCGVAICFDDGWQGAVTRAAPLLATRNVPALFFITTGFVGQPFFAQAAELRALDPRLFTLGSHGVTHRMLSDLPLAEIRAELSDSRRRLEDILGRSVETLSIPGGAVNARVVAAARDAGYCDVFTSTISLNPTPRGRYDIARIGVTRATTDEQLRNWLAGRLGRERWRKALLGLPKRVLGMRNYTRVRRALLGDRGHAHHFEP